VEMIAETATTVWIEHGTELRFWLGGMAVAAVLSWRLRSRLGNLMGAVVRIDGNIERINGSVAENTRHRHALEDNPPISRREWDRTRQLRDQQTAELSKKLDSVRRFNLIQLDDLNARRAEKGLPPVGFD
jgi:hypothetical protein